MRPTAVAMATLLGLAAVAAVLASAAKDASLAGDRRASLTCSEAIGESHGGGIWDGGLGEDEERFEGVRPEDVPPPDGWPMAYLPTLEDTGGGFVPAQWPGLESNPGPGPQGSLPYGSALESHHFVVTLGDNPGDGFNAQALRFADGEAAASFVDVDVACDHMQTGRCGYYPHVMVLSGPVVTTFQGTYEPHDGREGTERMMAGLEAAAQAVADRTGGEVIGCPDWVPQKEELLTPTPAPQPEPQPA